MLIWIILIIAFVYLDQITKYLAVIFLKTIDTFPIIQDVIHFTYVENRGAAFGMLKNHRWVFMIVSVVGIVALTWYLVKHRHEGNLQSLALSMIVAGGIGNMIDRVVLGYVVDFIDFTLIDFAVFNVADMFVCVGCGLEVLFLLKMLWDVYQETKAEQSAAKAESTDANKGEGTEASPSDMPAEKDKSEEPQNNAE